MKKLFIILFIAIGCGSEDPQTKFQVDAQLSVQVESFYTEAQAYGYNPERANLIVKAIPSGSIVSKYYVDGGQRIIEVLVLDPSACQELPVFREMAHALLNKPYSAEADVIMNQDTNPCAYVHTGTGEFLPTRVDYLNELFQ